MCLTVLEDYPVKRNYGYKVYNTGALGALHTEFGSYQDLPVGKWLDEEDYRPMVDVGRQL